MVKIRLCSENAACYVSAHFRRLLAIFVLICNIFINHSAKTPLLSKRK